MTITQDEINSIRTSVNIIDIIGNYIPLTKRGKNYFCVCPFHDDQNPSMSVSEEKQIYKCFSCGASGNVFTFIQNYNNVGFLEAVSTVAKASGISVNIQTQVKSSSKFKTEYEIMNFANKFFQNNLKTKTGLIAKNYLIERGFSEDILSMFDIGLALDDKDSLVKLLNMKNYTGEMLENLGLGFKVENSYIDAFTKRIIFPIHNPEGQIVAFTARLYKSDDGAKYINSKETAIFKKGHILYNYHNAVGPSRQEKNIIIVEGNVDVVKLASYGIKNVVALMGTSLTKEQVVLLKKLRVDIILCLDSDNAGLSAMDVNGEMLYAAGCNTFVTKLTDAKDPDEYIEKFGIEAFKKSIFSPTKYFDYHLSYLRESKNLENADDLAKYINEVIKYLQTIDDDILRNITINKLNADYNVSIDILKSKLASTKPKEVKKVEEVVKKKNKNKYEIAAEKILFFMLNKSTYIKMYEKQLGYFEQKIYRDIAHEIVYYYRLNKDIDIADFISFVNNKELINEKVLEIISNGNEEEINEEIFSEYIEVIKRELILNEIKELKNQVKEELDINKKVELLKRLTEIKKEV